MEEASSSENAAADALLLFDSSSTASQSNKSSTVEPQVIIMTEEEDHDDAENIMIASKDDHKLDHTVTHRQALNKWNQEDDDRLFHAIGMYGEHDWKRISEHVGTKDKLQCRQRWQKVVRPGIKKGKWTEDEDKLLIYVVQTMRPMGITNWRRIAEKVPNRTSKQCRERWNHHLSPDVNKDDFTIEEDQKLVDLSSKYGTKWSRIAREMPGRTENSVRSRCHGLKTRNLAVSTVSTPSSSPRSQASTPPPVVNDITKQLPRHENDEHDEIYKLSYARPYPSYPMLYHHYTGEHLSAEQIATAFQQQMQHIPPPYPWPIAIPDYHAYMHAYQQMNHAANLHAHGMSKLHVFPMPTMLPTGDQEKIFYTYSTKR